MGSFRHLPSCPTGSSPRATGAHGLPGFRPYDLNRSLLDTRFDSDSCDVGLSRSFRLNPRTALSSMRADGKSSDGVGLTTAIPRAASFCVKPGSLWMRTNLREWE